MKNNLSMNRNTSEKNRKAAIKAKETHFHGICWCKKESKTLNIEGWCFACELEDAELQEKREGTPNIMDDLSHFEHDMEQQGITDETQRKEIYEKHFRY